MPRRLLLVLAIALTAGCGVPSGSEKLIVPADMVTNPRGINVTVRANGQLLVGRDVVTLEQLGRHLDRVQAAEGSVWYYREHPDREPPPIADKVMRAIINRQLPVSFSTQPDFSDYVDQQGVSRPRT